MNINSICIVGGGTSGWLTAAYIIKNLPNCTVSLVESSKIGIIGVGEGTQPYTTTFLRRCGLEPKDWMPQSDATYKLGVEFSGWHDHTYFVDNDSTFTHRANVDKLITNYWVGKNPQEYYDWLPAYRLARANVSPKLDQNLDFVIGSSTASSEAVHFNAFKIGDTLKNLFKDQLTHFDEEIIEIEQNAEGIENLTLASGYKVTADFYIDCSGFKSLLIEKTLGVKHTSINSLLPCDKAVAIPTQYQNPNIECHPYTKSTAMNSGWKWTIPTYNRIGNGYVYSSKFIDKDQAELELRTSLNEFRAEALHLDMRCGFKEQICYKNVLAVGLSAGFVEPLEATGITFTTKTVELFVNYLKQFDYEFNANIKLTINEEFMALTFEIISFIFLHYFTSSKRNTEFWKYFEDAPMPEFIKIIAREFVPYPPAELHSAGKFSMFHSGQWFQILNIAGQYKDVENLNSEKENLYYLIHKNMLTSRTDDQIKYFPNHYEFLQNWYQS